jgi:hypothetical protein
MSDISSMHKALVLVLFTIPLGACGFVHDERIDGPYRLVAIDVWEEMAICYEIENGCIGRIPETVYTVGFDAKYLVAARHPNNDQSKTEYYYLTRALDGPLIDPSATVSGPFNADEFEAERTRLNLPPFSRTL